MNSTRKVIAAAIACALGASVLGAQATDARWQAWIGCWSPVDGEGGAPRQLGGSSRVCVLPGQTASAVEIVTVASGKAVDRTRINADGARHQVSRDGCTGTEVARWASSGTRVYTSTDVTCTGGVRRVGNGVMSFTQRYEWLDVRGMNSREASGVAVARYAAIEDTAGIPAEVQGALRARSPETNNAILAASSPLTLADIADVAQMADSGVAATWLMERTQGVKLSINGKQLESLADHGVPPSLIDVVVAIAHPNIFALNPASRDAEFKARGQQVTGGTTTAYRGIYGYPGLYGSSAIYGYPFGFAYGWSPYSYGYGSFYPYYGFGGYGGYGGFGYYSPYSYGYYPGSQPIVVVTRPGDDGFTSQPHGRVVKGQGYTSGARSGSGSSGGSSSSTSGGGGGSGSTGGSASGSGSSAGAGARTAVKKP